VSAVIADAAKLLGLPLSGLNKQLGGHCRVTRQTELLLRMSQTAVTAPHQPAPLWPVVAPRHSRDPQVEF
jgi:hypothetical protein